MADDLSVVNGARVSFAPPQDELDESDEGLIRFLMRDRHGCYDDATDVLTADGWKPLAGTLPATSCLPPGLVTVVSCISLRFGSCARSSGVT